MLQLILGLYQGILDSFLEQLSLGGIGSPRRCDRIQDGLNWDRGFSGLLFMGNLVLAGFHQSTVISQEFVVVVEYLASGVDIVIRHCILNFSHDLPKRVGPLDESWNEGRTYGTVKTRHLDRHSIRGNLGFYIGHDSIDLLRLGREGCKGIIVIVIHSTLFLFHHVCVYFNNYSTGCHYTIMGLRHYLVIKCVEYLNLFMVIRYIYFSLSFLSGQDAVECAILPPLVLLAPLYQLLLTEIGHLGHVHLPHLVYQSHVVAQVDEGPCELALGVREGLHRHRLVEIDLTYLMIVVPLGGVDELYPGRKRQPGVLIEYFVPGLGLRGRQLVRGNDDAYVLVALLEVSIQVLAHRCTFALE